MRKIKLLLPLLLLVLSLTFLVGCFESTSTKATSYVTLDINPSVEMVVDDKDVVEFVNALNADADVLLANLDLEGMNVEEAVDAIIEESTDLGYIDPEAEETVVEVTTVTDDPEDEEALGEKIRNKVNNAFIERGMHGYAQKKQMTPEIIAEAEELGIGAGVLRLIKQVQELNPDLTLEELLEMNVQDLNALIKEKGNEVKEMTQALREDFFAQRDVVRAEYQPQIEALETQIAALEAQIEAELDETAKAALQEDLAELVASLEALEKECSQEVKQIRDSFQDEITAARTQLKDQHRQRVEEHKAKVEEFKQNFQKNKEAIKDQIDEWINQRKNGKGN